VPARRVVTTRAGRSRKADTRDETADFTPVMRETRPGFLAGRWILNLLI
jgi:hypothetical protein